MVALYGIGMLVAGASMSSAHMADIRHRRNIRQIRKIPNTPNTPNTLKIPYHFEDSDIHGVAKAARKFCAQEYMHGMISISD